jgi:hypothetical protein
MIQLEFDIPVPVCRALIYSEDRHISTEKKFVENFVAGGRNLAYRLQSFLRLFWGEQPPFTPIGRGGR